MKLPMEVEVNGCLPFLDILLSRMYDGFISHQVFHKKTHNKQCLHATSHHCLAPKMGFPKILSTQALRISHEYNLEEQKTHILSVFENNGYRREEGLRALQNFCIES